MTSPAPAAANADAAIRRVPFDGRRHAGLGIAAADDYRWCAAHNALPLTAAEFFVAALHYPLAFLRDPQGLLTPVAITGLRDAENLFVDVEGRWRADTYLPAYVRRYPFSLADFAENDTTRRLICVDESRLSASATPALLDPSGQPTPAWQPIRELLEAIDGSWQQTQTFMQRLEKLELLQAFDAVAVPSTGARLQLRGLLRIDEAKLAALPADELRSMLQNGELRALHAHLLSLEHFGRLLNLAQQRDRERSH